MPFMVRAARGGARRRPMPMAAQRRARPEWQTRHRACPVPDSRSVPTQKVSRRRRPMSAPRTHPPEQPASQCSHGRDARNGRAVAIVAAPDTSQTPPPTTTRTAPPLQPVSAPAVRPPPPGLYRLFTPPEKLSSLGAHRHFAPCLTGPGPPATSCGLGTSTPAPERRLRIRPSSGASLHISTSRAHEPMTKNMWEFLFSFFQEI
jgi:hypothetical protein